MSGFLRQAYGRLAARIAEECRAVYGDSLVSVVVYGSVARGTPNPCSDLDVLIVAENLPDGRMRRVEQFAAVERGLAEELAAMANAGLAAEVSPMFKTPSEVEQGSPLFLEMLEDAVILVDRGGFFASYLDGLRRRLRESGAHRVRKGDRWCWVLHPGHEPGEVSET